MPIDFLEDKPSSIDFVEDSPSFNVPEVANNALKMALSANNFVRNATGLGLAARDYQNERDAAKEILAGKADIPMNPLENVSTIAGGPPVSVNAPLRSSLNEIGGEMMTGLPSRVSEVMGAGGVPEISNVEEFPPTEIERAISPAILRAAIGDDRAVQVGRDIANMAIGLGEFITSPTGAIAAAGGYAAPIATATAFTVDMLKNLGQGIRDVYKNWDQMSPVQKQSAITQLGGQGLMTLAVGAHAKTGIRSKIQPAYGLAREIEAASKQAQLPVPPRTGLVLEGQQRRQAPIITESQFFAPRLAPQIPGFVTSQGIRETVPPSEESPIGRYIQSEIDRTTPRVAPLSEIQTTRGLTEIPIERTATPLGDFIASERRRLSERPTVPETTPEELAALEQRFAPVPEPPAQKGMSWQDIVDLVKEKANPNLTKEQLAGWLSSQGMAVKAESAGKIARAAWGDKWTPQGKSAAPIGEPPYKYGLSEKTEGATTPIVEKPELKLTIETSKESETGSQTAPTGQETPSGVAKPEEPSPDRPPQNPIRKYLKPDENMNQFLHRATDEELMQAQKDGRAYYDWLKEEQDYRKKTKDETWREMNPVLYDADHFTSTVNHELVRRSAEKQAEKGSENAIPIGETETVPLAETPGGSKEVGAQVRNAEASSNVQGNAQQIQKPEVAKTSLLPKPKARDWTDRNKFVGEDFAGPKNSIVIQLRGLDTNPIGTGKPTVLPFDGNPKTAAKTIEMVFPKLADEVGASMRESVIKATDANGNAIYHFEWKPQPEGVGYASQQALNEARAKYREVTSGKSKAPIIDVSESKPEQPKQLTAPPASDVTAPTKIVFEVGDEVTMHSPHTGEDTIVNFRGVMPDGKAVIWTGKTQFPVPMDWLRKEGTELRAGSLQGKSAIRDQGSTSQPPAPTEVGVRVSPSTLSKPQLIEEILGKKPEGISRVQDRVQWDSDAKRYGKFTKQELVNIVESNRVEARKRSDIQQLVLPIFDELKAATEAAGKGWRSILKDRAEKEGVNPYYPQDSTRGEAAAIIANKIAERRYAKSQQPNPAAEKVKPAKPTKPEVAPKEPWQMTDLEFMQAAKRGKIHKATGNPTPGIETKANTPLSIGEREGYSADDIAHFYVKRRGGFRKGIADSIWFDAIQNAREELIRDALREGKPVPPEVLKDYPELAPKEPAPAAEQVKSEEKPTAEARRLLGESRNVEDYLTNQDKAEIKNEEILQANAQDKIDGLEKRKQTASAYEKIGIETQIRKFQKFKKESALRVVHIRERAQRVLSSNVTGVADIPGKTQLTVPTPPAAEQAKPAPAETAPEKGPELTGMGGAVPSEFGPQAPFTTAAKNAAIDRDRIERGQEPMMSALKKSDQELWAQAMNILDNDWQAPDKLIAQLKAAPRVLLDYEHMVLLARRVDLKNEWYKAQRERELAIQENRPEAAEDAKAVRDDMMARLNELDSVIGRGDTAAGTLAGRALRARQLVMNEDYSLADMVLERETILDRKLTDTEIAETKRVADEHARLNAEYDQLLKSYESKVGQPERIVIQKIIKDVQKLNISDKVLKIAEDIVASWDKAGEAAKQRLLKRTGQFSAAIDPTILSDVAILGRSYLGHAALDVAKFTKRLVEDLGEWAREYAAPAFKQANELIDQEGKTQKPAVKEAIKIKKEGAEGIVQKIAKQREQDGDISYYVRKLAKHFVIQGERDAQALVDKVHAAIQTALPNISKREVMDAISGYGKYSPLRKGEIDVILRDLKGQMQQIAKLEDLTLTPPTLKKTGHERRTPSDAERRLIKQVEAKKREVGYEATDPETQLRGALQAAKTRLENQIKDLQYQIEKRQKIVKEKRVIKPDEELEALRVRRDLLKNEFDQVFPKTPLTNAERLQIWKERTAEKILELTQKVEMGDIAKRKRPEPVRLDPEAIRLRYDLHKVHNAWLDLRLKDELSKRNAFKRTLDSAANTVRFVRAAMTGGEFSGVLRQGGFIAFGHPIRATKTLAPMFKALMSEQKQFEIMEEIMTRPNAPLYERAKLELTETGVRLSNMEEHYMFKVSDRMRKIPGFGQYVKGLEAFQRAYVTFLNRLRADSFDAMVDAYGSAPETISDIANFINVTTGRGSTGLGNRVGAGANAIFFAPRYSISRLQLLGLQPILRASKGNRTMIAKEYLRALTGAAVVLSLGYMYAKAKGEDQPLEFDPRSADFGKIKIGNTRIDPMFGLAQWVRLISSESTGTRKTQKGEIRPLRESGTLPYEGPRKMGPYEQTGTEMAGRFAWSKLAPVPESFVSMAGGKNVVGQPETVGKRIANSIIPITYKDIYDAYRYQDPDTATVMSVLAVLGMGLNTYQDRNQ